MEYRSNHNVVFSCKYHVIFCPKYRRPVLTGQVAARCGQLVVETAAMHKCIVIEMEIMPDHVHLLIDVDPQFGIHRVVKAIKGITSRLIRQEFPAVKTRMPSLWTNSYFVSTVGGAPLEIVKRYIENQKTGPK